MTPILSLADAYPGYPKTFASAHCILQHDPSMTEHGSAWLDIQNFFLVWISFLSLLGILGSRA